MSATPDTGGRPHGAPTPEANRKPSDDLALTDRWTRSIQRSRTRRRVAAAARRRRFRLRGAATSLAAVVALSATGAAGVAVGQSGDVATGTLLTVGSSGDAVAAVEEALGLSADGYYDRATARSVRDYQAENGLLVDGIVGPETSAALGLAGSAPAQSSGSGGGSTASPTLQAIAECESGGDPTAVSADGQYRGKYQFSRATWRGLGGKGDPAAAPEWLQDRMALKLYRQSGTAPWPNCP